MAAQLSHFVTILSLRRRHRRMFAILSILLPAGFIAGVAARRPIPPSPARLAPLLFPRPTFSITEWVRNDLFTNIAIRVQLLREALNTNRTSIKISTAKEFIRADLLVYWLPAGSILNDSIPEDAILLGAFLPDQSLPVPLDLNAKSGSFVLYSLATQEIVGTSWQLSLK